MPGRPPLQLEFAFVSPGKGRPRFLLTDPLKKHGSHRALLVKLHYAIRFFPELEGRVIRVGLTRSASGLAVPGGSEIWLNPAYLSYYAVVHELVHLLQGEKGLPQSERSCDLHALARHWTLNDLRPYYLRIPRELLAGDNRFTPEGSKLAWRFAREALDLRKNGLRNYIAAFERMLAEMAAPAAKRTS